MNSLTAQVTAIATSTVATVTSFPHDLLVIVGLFVLFGAYAFFFGKGKSIALILALYVASFLFTYFPIVDFIQRFKISLGLASAVIFGVLLIVSLLALRRVFRIEYTFGKLTTGIEMFLLAGIATVLSVALSQNVIPVPLLFQLSPTISLYLNQPYVSFFAFFAPLLAISLISIRRTYD